MVYPVRNTTAQATITAVEKWILPFGIPQSIIHDRGTAFINTEFITWTKELRITLRHRTAYSAWTNGKIEAQNQHIARYWRNFPNDAGNNWSSLVPKFAFAHNTLSYSLILHENSDITYGSISSLDNEEADCEKLNLVTEPTDQMEDDEEEDEDDHIFKTDTIIDHYRLCEAKTAHDSVLGKIDASIAKKPSLLLNLLIWTQKH